MVIILNQYILKKNHSTKNELVKKFAPCSGKCEYQLHYRSKDKDKPWSEATIFHQFSNKNHKKDKNSEKDGCKIYKIDKLTLITYNSIKIFKPIFYNHMPKPMLATKILQLID